MQKGSAERRGGVWELQLTLGLTAGQSRSRPLSLGLCACAEFPPSGTIAPASRRQLRSPAGTPAVRTEPPAQPESPVLITGHTALSPPRFLSDAQDQECAGGQDQRCKEFPGHSCRRGDSLSPEPHVFSLPCHQGRTAVPAPGLLKGSTSSSLHCTPRASCKKKETSNGTDTPSGPEICFPP